MKKIMILLVILIPTLSFSWDLPDECYCLLGDPEVVTATYYDNNIGAWR